MEESHQASIITFAQSFKEKIWLGFADNRELGPTVVKKGVAVKLFEDE